MDINLGEYEAQLAAVEQALRATANTSERAELETLKANLMELLELTKQTARTDSNRAEDGNVIDDEMVRFMNEIGQLEEDGTRGARVESVQTKPNAEEFKELKTKLEEMMGRKCSAPHKHTWGAVAYHNAIVCAIADTAEVDEDGALDVRLRVLFTNPTHREMLPCSYFLEGECRFDEAKCHYSHGELVPLEELRDYSEPNFELLGRNCVVLAKLPDRLWHRGRVLCANFVEKSCRVRLDGQEHKERERDFAFEDLFPIYQDDVSEGDSSGSSDESDEDLDELEFVRRAALVEKSLFTFQPTQPLGEWERHTKGIGSKLMAKMGYIHGTGLGSDGRGIVTPISAQILPQGRSLDHCMELREAANGDKDLFSVEKKLRREHRKQTAINAKAYEREAQRVDLFSFLNDNVFGNNSKGNGEPSDSSIKKGKPALRDQTTKSLNVESVRIADDIRRKEREIAKVQQSVQRNSSGTELQKRLQMQLSTKTRELEALQREEKYLSKEQATRRTKDKLCVF